MSWISKHRAVFVLISVLLVGIVLAFAFTPPFFAEFGRHYVGGSGLASVSGIYRCADEVITPDCEPVQESLMVAIANDPDIRNWLPIRIELIRLPESYE